jgi:hypothetical protein
MLEVTKWISYDEADKKPVSVDLAGGWCEGHNWEDYVGEASEEHVPHLFALRKSIVANNIKLTGADHQNLANGVPLFSDNTVALFTFRGWGDLLACIWNTEENTTEYTYMSFYW